jgi:hypothetical protein
MMEQPAEEFRYRRRQSRRVSGAQLASPGPAPLHRIEMQISAHLEQIFFGLDDRTLESALKQMSDYRSRRLK